MKISLKAGTYGLLTRGQRGSPPLVLLHGFMGSAAAWGSWPAHFAESHFVIAPDLPGHGHSTGLASEASYTMSGAARAIVEMLDEFEINSAHVLGYSMGGRLALYLALSYPARVTSLVLESASPGLQTDQARQERRAVDAQRSEEILDDFDGFLGRWYDQPLFRSVPESVRRNRVESRRQNDPQELVRSLRGMGTGAQPSLWNHLSSLSVDTLALSGSLDQKYVSIGKQMAERSPKIEHQVIPRAGHVIHDEQPEAFREAVCSRLSKAVIPPS